MSPIAFTSVAQSLTHRGSCACTACWTVRQLSNDPGRVDGSESGVEYRQAAPASARTSRRNVRCAIALLVACVVAGVAPLAHAGERGARVTMVCSTEYVLGGQITTCRPVSR